MAEFTTPGFLENRSANDFHESMKANLPANIDTSEGGHVWNLTRVSALVAAEICEFILPEVVKLCFPEWSYGEFLDGHASARGITRRAATAASGELTITGAVNTIIPAGSMFSTASVNDEPSVDYKTLSDAIIPESGSVTVGIQCTQTGTVGNTGANTIVLVSSKLTGVTAVTNKKDVTGGTADESDETLISRIDEYDKSQGDSFTGSPADYKRWATSVAGVGEATVISAQDDTGLVKIILTDSNGAPATEDLRKAVYNYIMRPDAPGERLAPCNAYLSVVPPDTINIGIKATIELEAGASIEAVKAAFVSQLELYLPVALDEGEVKYTRVAAVLAAVDGANDFKDMEIGIKTDAGITYGTANIPITTSQLPTVYKDETGQFPDVILTIGTV